MPLYSFVCDSEDGGCGHEFDINCYMCDYDATTKNIKCPQCGKTSFIHRKYEEDNVNGVMGTRTLGSLAEKNSAKLSDEAKARLNYEHKSYLFDDLDKPLPDGMKRLRQKPVDGKYLPPTIKRERRNVNKKKK